MKTKEVILFALSRQWLRTPVENYRLLSNFTRQDFSAQYTGSIAGFFWLFLTPIANIAIYSFVFGYVFQLRALPEFRETEFVLFMMLGYLPWFALAESVGKSTSLLIEKAGLITKVKFPVQILPVVCSLSSLHDPHNRFFSTLELSDISRLFFCAVALDTSNLSDAVFIHYGTRLYHISVKCIFKGSKSAGFSVYHHLVLSDSNNLSNFSN